MKNSQPSYNDEIFYIYEIFCILLVILTGFGLALINISTLFMGNMSDVVQKCSPLIRKLLSGAVKNFINTDV